MKIFHTADWHLGKLVQGQSMIEDQKYILNKFIEQVKEEKPDVIIIAGDLYDRAIPPPEAVDLLNHILRVIIHELHIPILAIAGNHDSPSRLDFGKQLMKEQGFHIVGTLQRPIEKITLEDEFGPVHFYMVPFADPSVVRSLFEDEDIHTYDQAMEKVILSIKETIVESERNVLIGHAFVTPFGEEKENTSDSEKRLSIGGAEYVSAHHFSIFDYTALGHLHQSHYVQMEMIRYAGSILKYSLSEQHHQKGYVLVELQEKGNISVEKVLLEPKRDIRTVRGMIDDILQFEKNDDYTFVELLDEKVIIHPMEKIRTVFPNAMQVKRVNDPIIQKLTTQQSTRKNRELSDSELFRAFYEHINGKTVPANIEKLFAQMIDKQMEMERETKGDNE